MVIAEQTRGPSQTRGPAAKQGEDQALGDLGQRLIRGQGQGGAPVFPGQAHCGDAVLPGQVHHHGKDAGMEVQIDMAVQMPDFKAGPEDRFDLGRQLPADFRQETWTGKVTPAGGHGVVREKPLGIDQVRHCLGGQHGPPLDQGEVDPQAETGEIPGQAQGRLGPGARGHEAGTPEEPLAVGQSHRAVQRVGEPEVVGGEDDGFVRRGVFITVAQTLWHTPIQ